MPDIRPLQITLAVFDKAVSDSLCDFLRKAGHLCELLPKGVRLENLLRDRSPDLVIAELGREAVPADALAVLAGETAVAALAAPNPDIFFQAAKSGVQTVISLPLDAAEYTRKLSALCDQLQKKLPAERSHAAPSSEKSQHPRIPSLFATSSEMAEVRDLIEKVAPTSATVLIRGESGVGKELAAKMIHARSLRAASAFLKVNCAAIPNDLLESELFGYEPGAFTGAVKGKPGKFELADGGTIFLDEIGEMHPLLQAKLLHVLQDGEFARLGAKRDISVDVRVICATNKPLDVLVASKQFREDLYYRINVVTVNIPALRFRRSEIPILADYFLRLFAGTYGKPYQPLSASELAELTSYDWPGNIRELENLCKRHVIVGGIARLVREMKQRQLPENGSEPEVVAEVTAAASGTGRGLSLLEIGRRAAWAAERTAIGRTLAETKWNRKEAARRLQISYKALLNKIQQMEEEAEVDQEVMQ